MSTPSDVSLSRAWPVARMVHRAPRKRQVEGIDRPAKVWSGSRINPGSSKSGVEPRLDGGQMGHPGICAVRRRAIFTRRLSSQRCSPRCTVPCKKLDVRILHYNVTLHLVRWERASGCGYVLAWPSQTGSWPPIFSVHIKPGDMGQTCRSQAFLILLTFRPVWTSFTSRRPLEPLS